jgi:hypothetical protein
MKNMKLILNVEPGISSEDATSYFLEAVEHRILIISEADPIPLEQKT